MSQATRLMEAMGNGDPHAAAKLLPLVYAELRKLAHARMAQLPPGQTLQPTALVHEAYLRLLGKADLHLESRRHFFFAAALSSTRMRRARADVASTGRK